MAELGDQSEKIKPSSSFIDSLAEPLRSRVTKLQDIQNKQATISTQLSKEIHELEKKYWSEYEPLFQKRHEIVTGIGDPSHINTPPGIPEFWLTAMKKHPDIGAIIDEDRDEAALKYITDIKVEHLVGFDFALAFYFAPNEFFSNLVIRKVFRYKEEFVGDHPDPLLATGDQIGWRPGRDLTLNDDDKIQSKDQASEDEEDDQAESFFKFFSPPSVPPEGGEVDEDERKWELAMDYELGEQFKDEFIPRAVDWYTGDAVDDSYFNKIDYSEVEDDSDDDTEDEDDDEDDDDDDDDDDEDNDNEDNDGEEED